MSSIDRIIRISWSVKLGQMNVFGYLESCRYRYHLQTADI